ncbi:MFS general substrate transporter [Melanomma pulvis-pyrius CBS 109.77]|uniref:MFS general substrate transporter n=1 Tax=Melanomma pulvis-pyrius CBS 109.77 TaxID=1314802 RepID=A0A6A6XR30_9PLEO|nr:MFS general substrate transporter [Melanomma pulvis-pyrius CBS 109.77]
MLEPDQNASYRSLPKKGQLAIRCLARLADPLAISSIQSYLFYQLRFFSPHATDAAIATQAGVLVGARTTAQVITGMLWGRLADSEIWGRKMVLFIGLGSCGISYIGYGFARSFPTALFWQVFAGLMSNNVAITRCIVAEFNPEKGYPFSLLHSPPPSPTAQLLGPLIGGLLSSNSGSVTSQSGFPYLFPNLLIAGLYLGVAVLVLFYMEETLESLQGAKTQFTERMVKRLRQQFSSTRTCEGENEDRSTEPLIPSANNDIPSQFTPLLPNPTPTPVRKLPFRRIWTPNVLFTILSHFIIVGHLGTFSNLWAIFLTTPVGPLPQGPLHFTGGLGMISRNVGFALSLAGGTSMLLQLTLYPILQERFGTLKIWRTALFVFPLVYVVAPYPSLLASSGKFKGQTVGVWLAMNAVLLLFTIGRTGVVPTTTLLINDCTPHPSVRGTIHAAATVLGHLSRSIFPVVALTVFGQGLRLGVVGLGFWCLAVLAVASCVASAWVREEDREDIGLEVEGS